MRRDITLRINAELVAEGNRTLARVEESVNRVAELISATAERARSGRGRLENFLFALALNILVNFVSHVLSGII